MLLRVAAKIGICDDALHCPNASANLVPVDLINMCGTTITFGMRQPNNPETRYCEINLISRPRERRKIEGFWLRDLWWIKRSEMFDLLFRNGFTVEEVKLFKLQDAEEQFVSRLALI